jgi:hypothetical protein
MDESDDKNNESLTVDDDDFFQDTLPDGPMYDFIKLLLTKYAKIQDNFPADLLTQYLDTILEYKMQLKIETDSINIHKLNFAKLEHMSTERQKKIILFDTQSISEELKKLDVELIKKKVDEFRQLGIRLRRYQDYPTTLMTVNGPIVYSRIALRPATSEYKRKLEHMGIYGYIFPLDIGLGISRLPHKMTIEAMLTVAREAAKANSYEEAEQEIKRLTRIRVSDDTLRSVTDELGLLVHFNDVVNTDEVLGQFNGTNLKFPETKRNGTLYLECDGAMIATRKEKDFHTTATEETKGAIWKENKLGVAFSSDNIKYYKTESGRKYHVIEKREYTSLIGSSDEFAKMMLAMAIRNGYGLYQHTVLISDGAEWIKNMKETYFADAVHILDFYHLSKHVHDYAKEIFDYDEQRYVSWAEKIVHLLKNSQSKEVIEIINNLPKKIRSKANNDLVTYINHNKNYIDYLTYKNMGFFIGSGAIESGNKIVLQRRLKQGAMRWNLGPAQGLLSLVAKLRSGLWGSDVVDVAYKHYAGATEKQIKELAPKLFNILPLEQMTGTDE